jgi:PAS domain S-box-containing protein
MEPRSPEVTSTRGTSATAAPARIISDIELALPLVEDGFRLPSDAITGFIYDWDPHTNRTMRFGGPDDFLGFQPGEVPDDASWWSSRMHPDDLPRATQAAQRAMESGAPGYMFEYRIRHRDGRWLVVVDRARIIRDALGRVVRVVGGTSDVSEQRNLERERERLLSALAHARARLVEIFDAAPSLLAMFRGPDHVIEYANEAYYQVVGRRDLLGQRVFDVFPEAREQGFKEILDRVLHDGVPYAGREMRIEIHTDTGPEEHFVDMNYLPLVEPDGTRNRVVLHGTDVTAHVRLRQEVERAHIVAEEARVRAEDSSRVKSEFLAVMSHELRTPLNAIAGYVELIEMGIRGPVTQEQLVDLARIQRSQRHLMGLINGVLNYSRVDAGMVHYVLADVRLDEIIAHCDTLTAPQMRTKRLLARINGCEPTLRVRADREKLEQILLNLLTNAMKFTDPGGRVDLYCDVRSETVAIMIADTGHGIPADQSSRIFEPFVQLDSTLTRTRDGVGLGLAISRDLARGMGGDLTVESEVGVGSTFVLTIPRAHPVV